MAYATDAPARRRKNAIAVELDQPHPLQTRMAVLADDDVVVHGDTERGGDIDDRFSSSGCRPATASDRHWDGCARSYRGRYLIEFTFAFAVDEATGDVNSGL